MQLLVSWDRVPSQASWHYKANEQLHEVDRFEGCVPLTFEGCVPLTRIGSESAMANISALNETSLSELSPALERGDISSREIVEQCLAAIQAS